MAGGEETFVVLDTAPSGHTILLLDTAEAYQRDVLRSMSDMPDSVKNLLPRLGDPDFTSVFLVTLPEATPVHEAGKLQHDLPRAGIRPFAWVINQSFNNGFRDPVLVERGLHELPYIPEVWGDSPPVGRCFHGGQNWEARGCGNLWKCHYQAEKEGAHERTRTILQGTS